MSFSIDNIANTVSTAGNSVVNAGADLLKTVDRKLDPCRRYSACRQFTGSKTFTTVNVEDKVYLNVGCWQNGATDFALICERMVVLCSWSASGAGTRFPQTISKKLPSKLGVVLADPRVSFVDCVSLVEQLTEKNELFVLIGDTHIHLFKECPCDDFVRLSNNGRSSLWPEFKEFVAFASQHADKSHILQLGDFYEIWEVQAIFDAVYDRLLLAKKHNALPFSFPHNYEKKTKWTTDVHDTCDRVAGTSARPNYWKAIKRHIGCASQELDYKWWTQNATIDHVRAFGLGMGWYGLDAMKKLKNINQPIKFTKDKEIISAISKQYKEDGFDDVVNKITIIKGNHDNQLPNKYLDNKLGGALPKAPGSGSEKDNSFKHQLIGRGDRIWIEHGHAFDPYNNNTNYCERAGPKTPEGGFYKTLHWARAEMKGLSSLDHGKGKIATAALVGYARDRVNYVFENGLDGKRPCLVAMGHTHERTIQHWDDIEQLVRTRGAFL